MTTINQLESKVRELLKVSYKKVIRGRIVGDQIERELVEGERVIFLICQENPSSGKRCINSKIKREKKV